MWQALVWNIEFARGLTFFALGIVAAIILIPKVLERLQAKRDKRLAIKLLKQFGYTCICAITRSMPPTYGLVEIEGNTDGDIMMQFWKDIHEGRKQPDGSGRIICKALEKAIFSEKERGDEKSLLKAREQTYPFFGGEP